MTIAIRLAEPADGPAVSALLLADARQRQAANPALWALTDSAAADIAGAFDGALASPDTPFRQRWFVAVADGRLAGVVHSMRLPVPPIYAGPQGQPGLILGDCALADDAPYGTAEALIEAAEADLRADGAEILLVAATPGSPWEAHHAKAGYKPLTLYLSRTLPADVAEAGAIRPAGSEDIPGIVALSAENRRILEELDKFWIPHAEADARFGAWMTKSLELPDRDMVVAETDSKLTGFAVAQPATRLHFPAGHQIAGTGVLDDFHHVAFADPKALVQDASGGADLLAACEAAFVKRDRGVVFVVCPAAWTSKHDFFAAAGYDTALVWSIKRV